MKINDLLDEYRRDYIEFEGISGDAESIRGELGGELLHVALHRNRPEEVKLLLDAGANPNAREKDGGWRPLHYAVISNKPAMVKLLLQAGARCDLVNDVGRDAWQMARTHGVENMLKSCVEEAKGNEPTSQP